MKETVLQPGKRDMSLDILKGILTFFVITTHTFSFFPFQPVSYFSARLTNLYVVYTCLPTFSCFILILGYLCYKAYIAKQMDKTLLFKKLGKNFVKTMLTYYVSAISFVFFIKRSLSPAVLKDILLLRYVVEYSEFILTFAFLYVVVFLFEKPLRRLNTTAWIILVVLSLASTFFPYELVKEPLLAVFTGSTLFSSFSVFQYFCYFITGIYFAKNGIKYNKWLMGASALAMLAFLVYRVIYHDYPTRFPPSLLWIAGGAFFVYCGLLLCRRIPENRITRGLAYMGRESLYCMIFSNVVIFATHWTTVELGVSPKGLALTVLYVLIFVLSLVAVGIFGKIAAALKGKNKT